MTLASTTPIFVALLSLPLLGERVGGPVGLAVALAFAGAVAVVQPSLAVSAPVAAVAVLGSFLSALAMIWLRKVGPGETHEAVALHFSSVAAVTMVVLALPTWTWPDLWGGLPLVGAGLFGGAAQLAMTRAYALQCAAPVTAVSYLGIVFTHLLAVPVFGERPTLWQLGGSLLVIAAGVLVAAGLRRERLARQDG